MSEDFIYVLANNNGGEGYSPPLQAFRDGETARAAQKLASLNSYGSLELFAVPLWPNVDGEPFPKPVPR